MIMHYIVYAAKSYSKSYLAQHKSHLFSKLQSKVCKEIDTSQGIQYINEEMVILVLYNIEVVIPQPTEFFCQVQSLRSCLYSRFVQSGNVPCDLWQSFSYSFTQSLPYTLLKVQQCVAGLKVLCTRPFLWVLALSVHFLRLELCPQSIKLAEVATLANDFMNQFGSLSLKRVTCIILCIEMVQTLTL